jgi:hypothetical protein
MNNDFTAMQVEELNTEPRELSIDQLDNASGGFMWIPVVTVALFVAGMIHKAVTHTK